MTVQFISGFAKKENSTKRPEGIVSMSLFGSLRMPCSIMEPVIAIERLANDANPHIYTYAIIPNFGRFYFVEDWIWANGLWEVHLKEDVLATWKPDIGRQTEYILRTDSTTDFNEHVIDTIYPATTDIDIQENTVSSPFSPAAIDSGCYVVGIISAGSSDNVGSVTYYIMNSTLFGDLQTALFSDDNLFTMGITDALGQMLVTDVSKEVFKTMYNPYQYIASCMWFPINPVDIVNKSPVNKIKIGWWEYDLGGWILEYPSAILVENAITLPDHPQILRGSYLNHAPYTRRTLHGRFGTVPLDTAFFNSGDSVQARYFVDLITGKCRTVIERIHDNAIDLITEKEYLAGVPIQLAQVGTDFLGTVTTAVSTGASMWQQASRLNFAGAASTAVNGIVNAIQSQMPQLETSGSNGSFLSASIATTLINIFYCLADEDITHKGRPLCSDRRIDELDGFILCADGETDIACFDNERQAIARYLTSGFFWE